VHDSIKDLPGATPARDLLVSTALSYLDALAAQAGSDRGLQRELAESYDRLGDVQGEPDRQNSGKATAALASYTKALTLFQALARVDAPDTTVLSEMAMTHLKRSHVFMMVSADPVAAARESLQAIELCSSIVAREPQSLSAQVRLANAYEIHSVHEGYAGHDAASVEAADKAISIMEALYRLRPGDRDIEHQASVAYNARLMVPASKPAPAVIEQDMQLAYKALKVSQHLLDTDPRHDLSEWRDVAVAWNAVGMWASVKGDQVAALDAFRASLVMMEKTSADADNAQVQLDLARVRMNLGRAEATAGLLDAAYDRLLKDVDLLESILRQTDTYEIQYLLAVCEEELGTIEEQRALAARNPQQQLRAWQLAHTWFARSVPRFQPILRVARFGLYDRPPIDRASAGLTRSTAEIQRLQAQGSAAPR
jgi:tetratricopeptide (TPR) repeat protein